MEYLIITETSNSIVPYCTKYGPCTDEPPCGHCDNVPCSCHWLELWLCPCKAEPLMYWG